PTGPAVPLRGGLVGAAWGGLHGGGWTAIGAPPGRAPDWPPDRVAPTLTWVVPGAGTRATAGAGTSPTSSPGEGGASANGIGIGAPPPVRAPSRPRAVSDGSTATAVLRAAARPTATRAAAEPPADTTAVAWLEVWEVDEPPQFLVAPDDLNLARHVGRALRARVSLRIGSDGRPAGLEIDVDGLDAPALAALREALETSFAPLAFLPGRRDGRPVPVVQCWVLALDPQVPVALGMAPVN
ncbi:MAG: energy transducer TonB, partial [Burkholderiales bacterium]